MSNPKSAYVPSKGLLATIIGIAVLLSWLMVSSTLSPYWCHLNLIPIALLMISFKNAVINRILPIVWCVSLVLITPSFIALFIGLKYVYA